MYCENCGAKNEDAAKVCVNCGNILQEDAVETENTIPQEEIVETTVVEEPVVEETPVQDEQLMAEVNADIERPAPSKKPFPVKWVVTGAIAIVAAILVFFGAKWIMGMFGGSGDEYAYLNRPVMFVQNGNVMMYKSNFKEPVKVGKVENFSTVKYTEDGSKVFFIYDKKLYYRDVSEKEPKGDNADSYGVKISRGDVYSFEISKKGDFVLYNRENKLYASNLKGDPISITNDVSDYSLSENGKTIVYAKTVDNEKVWYTRGTGKNDEAVKIGSGINIEAKVGDGFEKIYFVDEGNLYLKEGKKEKVKITSDVEINCLDYEEIDDKDYLFLKKATKVKYTYNDLMEDDCKDDPKDPEAPERPYQSDDEFIIEGEDGSEEYDEEAYEKALEQYEKDYEEYLAIERRNQIREDLKDVEKEVNTYTYYKLDGTKMKEIAKDLTSVSGVFVTKAGESNVSKIKISSLEYSYDFNSKVDEMFANGEGGEKFLVKLDGTLIPYTLEDELQMITKDFKYIYLLEGKPEESSKGRTLVRYEITKSGLKSRKEIANDVTRCYTPDVDRDDLLVEIKTGETTVGFGLYNGKKFEKISEHVSSVYDVEYVKGTVYYVEDPSNTSGVGTLKKWKNGKDTKISDDVQDFVVRKDDKVYYIKDFSAKTYKGDLYQSGKKDAIAEGVSSIGVGY